MKNVTKIIACCLAVAMLTMGFLSCSKDKNDITDRSTTASITPNDNPGESQYNPIPIKSENFELTPGMTEYFASTYYAGWCKQYYMYFPYIGFDPNTPLSEQYVDSQKTQTWADFFKEGVKDQITTILKYCEAAKADTTINFDEYKNKAEKLADEEIANIKERASNYLLSYYISTRYGDNVSEEDIKNSLILRSIASDYADVMENRIIDSVTDQDMEDYFAANFSKFVEAEYLTFTIDSKVSPAQVDPDDYEGGRDSEAYKNMVKYCNEQAKMANDAQKLKDLEFIESLKNSANAEEFLELAQDHNFDPKIVNESYGITLSNELHAFLFGGVKAQYGIPYGDDETEGTSAKAGESKIDYYVVNEATGEYKLTIYYVTESASRDEEVIRDVGHILIKFDSSEKDTEKQNADAKAKAEEIYNELLKGATDSDGIKTVSKEAFEKLANEKNEDSNIFYNDVKKGQMVEPFEDWLFAATKIGEIGLVETTYGWHVMYYVGSNINKTKGWEVDAKSGVATEKSNAWFEALPYEVEINEKILNELFE